MRSSRALNVAAVVIGAAFLVAFVLHAYNVEQLADAIGNVAFFALIAYAAAGLWTSRAVRESKPLR
jgi:peptidoglycan/LPS O-acetylase OafA/YrhL